MIKISTRGRYAVRVMLDLAERDPEKFTPLGEVAARQQISLKYIEQILPTLKKNGLVECVPGKGGGCRLARKPSQCSIREILLAAEGDLAPVACLSSDAAPCPRRANCRTLPMWQAFADLVSDYFNGITLQDMAEPNQQRILTKKD